MVLGHNVENILAAEPILITVIVHEIAEPCRSEDLGFLTGSGGLLLLRFLDSRLDDVGVLQKQFFIDLLLVRETVAKFLVGIRRPYDVLFRRLICE
ncbi:hypothetical protein DW122_04975 [Bifidobacterium pseudocatenulatum]|nr:hypothetical protein DXD87_03075 [Bifidobacterium pseudocatenulatum]RGW27416.1 hypothetical protein DWV80_03090 [Bifidobacterium pseudocatenulatum]RGW29373.1 hypothetical protein DWV79_06605 [Bifidobacterium pseudocatenulatum]RGW51967.1 hypothetical protein DWV66_06565 [Bifidobacterium pseudocatenulatum]RGX31585.1 hypothetical protein DWV26_05305 [Bifidobacterium pseudocatenulatum]